MIKWIGEKVEDFKTIFRNNLRVESILEIGDAAQSKTRTLKGTDSTDGGGSNLNITASGASGTNQIGGGLVFFPGESTGNAVSRNIGFAYSVPVASGSAIQGTSSAFVINGNTGVSTFYKSVTITGTLTMGSTAALTNAGLVSVANQSNITGVGTITSGTWNGTEINQTYLTGQSGTNTGDQTNVTGSSGSCTGAAATVTSIGNLTGDVTSSNRATTLAASQANITTLAGVSAIGTAGTPIVVTSDTVTFTSASADDPAIWIKNTADDNQATRILFYKDRDAAGQAADECGSIYFYSKDSNSNLQQYGFIESLIDVPTHGQESGILRMGVASHDGGVNNGLLMQGGSVDTEVDVTIANGAASVTTVAGTMNTGKIVIDSQEQECLVLNTDGEAANSPYVSFQQDGTRRAFIQHNDTDNTLKLASEYGNVQVLAAASAGSDGDTAYMQVTAGGVFRFGAVDNDAVLTADGNMIFRIDADNDETGQSFAFQNNASTEIANLNESGDLQIDGKLTCASRTLAVSSSTDGDHDGDVVYFGGTTSMTIGKIYHYKSDGTWEIVNSDAVATSDGLLGVALGAASDTNGMLLRGMVTLDHDPGAVGDVLYVQSDNAGTPGNATATAPSVSGDCVRIIGYQVSHASNGNIWFNPDSTFVEVA